MSDPVLWGSIHPTARPLAGCPVLGSGSTLTPVGDHHSRFLERHLWNSLPQTLRSCQESCFSLLWQNLIRQCNCLHTSCPSSLGGKQRLNSEQALTPFPTLGWSSPFSEPQFPNLQKERQRDPMRDLSIRSAESHFLTPPLGQIICWGHEKLMSKSHIHSQMTPSLVFSALWWLCVATCVSRAGPIIGSFLEKVAVP